MGYRIRDGIVYMKICEVPLLITTNQIWKYCDHVKQLSPFSEVFWQSFMEGMSEDELFDVFELPQDIPEETVRKLYRRFYEEMCSKGYLIIEND